MSLTSNVKLPDDDHNQHFFPQKVLTCVAMQRESHYLARSRPSKGLGCFSSAKTHAGPKIMDMFLYVIQSKFLHYMTLAYNSVMRVGIKPRKKKKIEN